MKDLKKLLIAATLLLSLVGGAGQASADPGKGGPTPTTTTPTTTLGVTWEDGFGTSFSMGVTWE
jgi:hypothetical protein